MADPSRSASSSARRTAGRPAQKVLSQELITQAALQLIEDGGYERLTMSGLARALEVAPSALYNHVAAKQDVLVLIQDHIMTKVATAAFATGAWDEALRHWAWSYRDVFTRHTPLIPVIAVLPVTGAPQTLRMYEALTSGFLRAGWPEPLIVPAIVALESFIFGSAFDVTAPEDIFESGTLAESNPRFTSAVRAQHRLPGSTAADAAFHFGLEALITGLDAQRRNWTEPAGG